MLAPSTLKIMGIEAPAASTLTRSLSGATAPVLIDKKAVTFCKKRGLEGLITTAVFLASLDSPDKILTLLLKVYIF